MRVLRVWHVVPSASARVTVCCVSPCPHRVRTISEPGVEPFKNLFHSALLYHRLLFVCSKRGGHAVSAAAIVCFRSHG